MKKYIKPFTKYRKSKKGDVTCPNCIHSIEPVQDSGWFSRYRCGNRAEHSVAVSKLGTCDGVSEKLKAEKK